MPCVLKLPSEEKEPGEGGLRSPAKVRGKYVIRENPQVLDFRRKASDKPDGIQLGYAPPVKVTPGMRAAAVLSVWNYSRLAAEVARARLKSCSLLAFSDL